MRSLIRTLLIGSIVGYSLVCLMLFIMQEKFVFIPDKLSQDYQFSFPGNYEEVRFVSEGNILSALHFRTSQPKGVVLYFHGNAGSLRTWGEIAPIFTRRNYDLFIMDYRGYGKSTGQLNREADFHTDARAAYDYLRQQYDAQQIILFGRSLGTGVASRLAADVPARMLILETPYVSLGEIVASRMPFIPTTRLFKYPLDTYTWIGQVGYPIYIFHGTADNTVPYAHSQRLLPFIQATHELITLPGGGHGDLATFEGYRSKISAILAQP